MKVTPVILRDNELHACSLSCILSAEPVFCLPETGVCSMARVFPKAQIFSTALVASRTFCTSLSMWRMTGHSPASVVTTNVEEDSATLLKAPPSGGEYSDGYLKGAGW